MDGSAGDGKGEVVGHLGTNLSLPATYLQASASSVFQQCLRVVGVPTGRDTVLQ